MKRSTAPEGLAVATSAVPKEEVAPLRAGAIRYGLLIALFAAASMTGCPAESWKRPDTAEPYDGPRLTRRQILTVVKVSAVDIAECHAQQSWYDPDYVDVEYEIEPDGNVGRARLHGPRITSDALELCVLDRVRAMQYPPYGGRTMLIVMPFRVAQ